MSTKEQKEISKIKIEDTKESDLDLWGSYKAYLLWILKGKYNLEEAREDFLGIVNSKKYGRGNAN